MTKLSVYRMGEVSGEVLRESEYNQEKDRYNKMKIGRAKAEDLDFHENFLSNNSIECNPNLSLAALPGEKR